MPLRCVIVDDSRPFRAAARALLARDGIEVAGTAACVAEALELVRELEPQVLLVDIDLHGESGFELTRRVAGANGPRVILVSAHSEDDFADLIVESPALGFIAKPELSAGAVLELMEQRRA